MNRKQVIAGLTVVGLVALLVGVNYLFVPSQNEPNKPKATDAKKAQTPTKRPEEQKEFLRTKKKELKRLKKAAKTLTNLKESTKLATVNGTIITFGDVKSEYRTNFRNLPESVRQQGQATVVGVRMLQQVINKRISRTLFLQEARSEGHNVADTEIETVHSTIRGSFKDEDFYRMAIGQQDMSDTEFRQRIREELLIQKLVRDRVPDKEPSESAKRQYFRQMDTHPVRPERIHLYHIFVPGEQEAKRRAGEAANQLESGKKFAEVAKEYAQQPSEYDIGYVSRKSINDTYSERIFDLYSGDIAGPIETDRGFHIFKAIDHKDTGPVTYTEVRGDITKALQEERRRRVLKKILGQLRKAATITYHKDFLRP